MIVNLKVQYRESCMEQEIRSTLDRYVRQHNASELKFKTKKNAWLLHLGLQLHRRRCW